MRILAALVASSLVLSVAVPQTADACGNPIRLAGNKAVKKVAELEGKLAAGKNDAVLKDSFRFDISDAGLRLRAELVFAVAALRAGRDSVPTTWWVMREDLEEGDRTPLGVLRTLRTKMKDTPVIDARVAEALLRSTDAKATDEASTILEDLAARDVMPDAEAWASLAAVRQIKSDTAGRDAALVKCKKVATKSRRAAICKVSAPTS
jgi:hypothetical protein